MAKKMTLTNVKAKQPQKADGHVRALSGVEVTFTTHALLSMP